MAIGVREMRVDDLQDVKSVDLLCWNDLLERRYGVRSKLSQRTDENILSYLHADPHGAFVAAEESGDIVGTCFCHVLGRTGWVGPLSVLPMYQAMGLGKGLLKRAIVHLEDSGCMDIGLETMPENATNLGMYLRVGLRPEGLVVVLGKKLDRREIEEEPSGEVKVELFSESNVKDHLMAEARRISNALRGGLDYSPEVDLAQKFSLGDTIVATVEGEVRGFSVLHTNPRREDTQVASIRVLAVDPGLRADALQALLASSELMAADEGMDEITVPVPAVSRRALDSVLSRGYSVTQSFERLMWSGSSGMSRDMCNMCSWSG